jgi:hypothetical protein
MTNEHYAPRITAASDQGRHRSILHPLSFILHPSSFIPHPSSLIPHPIFVVPLAGALLGLFLARFWYELDPARFGLLGDWPGAVALAILGALFLAAQWWLALRRLIAPETAASVHIPFALLLVYIVWPEVDLRLAAIVLIASIGLAGALGLRALFTHPAHWIPFRVTSATLNRLAPAVLALVVFGTYLRTLGMNVGRADTFEFQVVAPTLGVAHPTGYPLFVIMGKLFSLLPFGSMAFRINLTSAVLATAATLVVYTLIARLTGRRLIAWIAALAFAMSAVMWSQAIVAEVYALNALIAGAVLALLIDLASPADHSTQSLRSVPILFLLLGLGLSHHLTTLLLLPAVTLAVILVRPRLPIRVTLTALGLFLLGLAVWIYIPLRWPALHNGTPMMLAELVDWITGARFGGALVLSAWSDPARWEIVGRFLLDAFGPAGALLAVAGLIGLVIRQRRAALVTFVALATYVFYGLVYFVPDISVFIIPAYLIMAIWIGAGVAFLLDLFARQASAASSSTHPAPAQAWRLSLYAVALAAFLLIPLSHLHQNFSIVDQRGAGRQAEDWGRYMLGLPIPKGAAILVDSEKIAPLYYLQVNENLRPDLDILVLGTEDDYRRELDARVAQGQPVYLARFLPNIPYPMRSLGPLVEVSGRRATYSTPGANQVGAAFGDVIELMTASVEAGDPARVTLEWRALTGSRPNYYVRLRLVDSDGNVRWEDAGAHPVSGYYPTGAWSGGEVVADYHEVEFNPAIASGAYTLEVGLFPPFREDGLLTGAGDMWHAVAILNAPEVTAPALDHTLRQTYGGQWIVTSAEALGVFPPSTAGQVRLNWAHLGIAPNAVRASLDIGASKAEPSASLVGGSSIRQMILTFRTPDQDGIYPVRLSLLDESGKPLPAKCGWLAPISTDCPLGNLQVAGEAIGSAINFGGQVLLTDWSIDRTEIRPGETINVLLKWRGLKPWEADYTAFVHLVGPDGKLHGQIDTWPVQGTLPTSSWAAGQAVTDPYPVTLQAGAPAGRYQIEVGWYLLATLRRLPVLDASSRPSDDRFIIGEVSVP